MKAILLSIKPKWVAKILNGEKTIEVRKLFPKDYVGWVYMYCSKDYKLNAVKSTWTNSYTCFHKKVAYADSILLNGQVVARFWCDKVEEIEPFEEVDSPMCLAYKLTEEKIINCQKAQLTYDEYNHYLKGKNGYAIHISKLEIFDKPRELGEFSAYVKRPRNDSEHICPCYLLSLPLTKSPQNYCYVEGE